MQIVLTNYVYFSNININNKSTGYANNTLILHDL